MDLSTMTITELKAAVYDQLILAEQAQKNIQVLNQAIATKSQVVTQSNPPEIPATDTGE